MNADEWYLQPPNDTQATPGSLLAPLLRKVPLPFIHSKILRLEGWLSERIVEVPWATQEVLKLPRSASILDVGCVSSTLPLSFASLGYKVTGVDVRRCPWVHPNFSFVQTEAANVRGAWDVLVCISAIEHFGYGEYWDPVGLDADLEFMAHARRLIRHQAILSFPFGAGDPGWHRVYDSQRLRALASGWSPSARFFARKGKAVWVEVSEDEASNCETRRDEVGAICLLSLKKLA